MRLEYDDVALMLERLNLPADLAAKLRRASVNLDASDAQVAALNEACVAHLQEQGFNQSGGASDLGRRLERIIDTLNED